MIKKEREIIFGIIWSAIVIIITIMMGFHSLILDLLIVMFFMIPPFMREY